MLSQLRTWINGVIPDLGLASATPDLMLTCFLSMLEVHARRAAPTINEDDAKKTVLVEIEASLDDLKRMSLMAVESAKGYPVWCILRDTENSFAKPAPEK